jgi:HEAT repeat protein
LYFEIKYSRICLWQSFQMLTIRINGVVTPLVMLMVFLLTLLLVETSSVSAQTTPSSKRILGSRTRKQINSIAPKFLSNDENAVIAAIDELSRIHHPMAVAKLAELARGGQPDAVTDHILETLGKTGSADAIAVLKGFIGHRRPTARKLAYIALGAIGGPTVPELITQGLRDSSGDVRAAAALALEKIGSKRELELLFWAFSKGVSEAAVAIGQLGDAVSVERFSGYVGRQPITAMLSGYERFLSRDDIPEETKIKIVDVLGDVSGPLVKEFFQRFLTDKKPESQSRLERSIQTAIQRIPYEQTPGESKAK